MKEIQQVSIWYNGSMVAATIYNLVSTSDNLSTSVTFYYQLFSASQLQLADGNLTMDGAFKKSTLLKKINANAPRAEIEAQWKKWNIAGGSVNDGLVNRRAKEIKLYFS